MNEPVQYGVGNRRVADGLVPSFHRELASHHRRAASVSVFQDLNNMGGSGGFPPSDKLPKPLSTATSSPAADKPTLPSKVSCLIETSSAETRNLVPRTAATAVGVIICLITLQVRWIRFCFHFTLLQTQFGIDHAATAIHTQSI